MSGDASHDSFDLSALNLALAGTRFAGKLRFFPSIHSTNTHAMAEAEAGAPEGMVYFADEQTAGRGRGAHAWASPPGSGLYVSVLLRPREGWGRASSAARVMRTLHPWSIERPKYKRVGNSPVAWLTADG